MNRRHFLQLSTQAALAMVAAGAWAPAARAALALSPGLIHDPAGRRLGAFDLDMKTHTVSRLGADGQARWTVGGLGAAQGQFNGPSAVATDEAGRVYVLDRGNARVQIFDAEGQWRSAFAVPSSARDLAVAGPGRVCVAESRGTVRVYQDGHECLRASSLGRPVAVTVDEAGCLHVLDAAACRVVVLGRDCREVSIYGAPGDGPGRFRAPRAIASGRGRVAVLDGQTGEVHVFAAGRLVDHHTPRGHAARIAWADGAWRLGA